MCYMSMRKCQIHVQHSVSIYNFLFKTLSRLHFRKRYNLSVHYDQYHDLNLMIIFNSFFFYSWISYSKGAFTQKKRLLKFTWTEGINCYVFIQMLLSRISVFRDYLLAFYFAWTALIPKYVFLNTACISTITFISISSPSCPLVI